MLVAAQGDCRSCRDDRSSVHRRGVDVLLFPQLRRRRLLFQQLRRRRRNCNYSVPLLAPANKSGPLCFGALPPPKQRAPGAKGTNLETPGHARVRSTTYVTPRQLFGKKTSKPLHDRDRFSARSIGGRRRLEISQLEGPLRTLGPRCLTTQGAETRPTALAPAPQHPGRADCWRNGWRNG